MSFAKIEKKCVKRLASWYEEGKHETTAMELFDGMEVGEDQQLSVCRSLEIKRAVKLHYELASRLPYLIYISPRVIDLHDQLFNNDKVDWIFSQLRKRWLIAIPFVVVTVAFAIFGFIQVVKQFYAD